MPTSRVWPSGIVNVTPLTYQIPLSGEINWSNLTDFLVALADGAQSTTFQKFAVRVAVTSPVTLVSPEDCVVATDLTVPGPVTVNLPAGSAKQIFFIIDGKGDASTNNVTIIPDGTDTIRGATSLVLANDRAAVMLAFNASDTDWKVIGPTILPGTISLADIVPVPADANMALVRDALGFVIDAFIADVNVSATAAIARSKLGLGTPDQVVINSPTGAFSSEAALAASRGGLGTNASAFTGVVHANAGVFTASPVVDADVAANAAINATKIADGSVDNTEFQRLGTAGTNGAGNLVTTDGVQTLTNKTLGSTNNITGATAASLTNAGTVTIPPGTDTLVNLNSVQTLTNKTISGASNTITNVSLTTGVTGILPIANGGTNAATANAALNNLLPAQAGNVGRVLGTDGTNTSWTTAGGGSGGINLVNSPSTADGWTETGTVFATPVTTTTAGDLPLTPEVTTAIQFVASGSGPETTDYNSYPFTVPPALGVKLGISLYLKPGTGFVSGQWTLSIYTAGGVRQSLSTDSAGVTLIPAVTGQFVSTFDAVAGTSYTVRIARTTGAGAATLNVAEVNVGTAAIVQGANVGPWVSFTPTITNVPTSAVAGFYRRVGTSAEIEVYWTASGGSTGTITASIPSGINIDTAAITAGGFNVFGIAISRISAINYTGAVTYNGNTTNVIITSHADGTWWDSNSPNTWVAGAVADIRFTVPIAEWAGSGTVNLSSNSPEYASNSGTWNTASELASFAYGPGGTAMGGTLSQASTKRVRFQSPIQAGETIQVELSSDRVVWAPACGARVGGTLIIQSINSTASAYSGVYWDRVAGSATDVDVLFGLTANMANDDVPADNWPSTNAYWRVKKVSGGQAVGFGEVVPGVSSGLVSASGLKGRTDGGTVAAGYVGQVISGTQPSVISMPASGQWGDSGSVALTPGVWQISGAAEMLRNGATYTSTDLEIGIGTVAGNNGAGVSSLANSLAYMSGIAPNTWTALGLTVGSHYVNIAVNTTYYLKVYSAIYTAGTPQVRGGIYAVRIA